MAIEIRPMRPQEAPAARRLILAVAARLFQPEDTAGFIYCSGQVAWDETEVIGAPGDLAEQTRRSLRNVERAVAAAGGTLRDVVSLRIYIVGDHIHNTGAIRQALLDTFDPGAQPATTWIGVMALANPSFAIEIEAIAVLD